jgi:hypothetical protein
MEFVMKLTKRQLRKIIKEEMFRLSVNDQEYDRGYDDGYNGYRVDPGSEEIEDYMAGYLHGRDDREEN